jgi:septum formation protein
MVQAVRYTKIILASGSPRRKLLLEQTGLKFTILKGDVNEDFPKGLEAEKVATYLSEKKAGHFTYALKDNDTLIITADTLVVLEGIILGKPSDYDDACSMLSKLSGQRHEVITGVTLMSLQKMHSFISTTNVFFKELTKKEIDYYVTHFRPYDKAGAYGIQEWIGHIGVERIEGSYFNVMGLPVQKLYHELMIF